ncbi:hypothetical protein [Cupriavidus sp. DF5525]
MQKVRFGLSLDDQRGWHPHDALGESTVGPFAEGARVVHPRDRRRLGD